MKKRPIFLKLLSRLREPRRFIQVLLGPRQVGKTTLALQLAEDLDVPTHYISADLATLQNLAWIRQQWEVARLKAKLNGALLIIDEVQKIPDWSETIKALWDEDTKEGIPLTVMILGSSPWLVQKGLSDSLAGRFEIIPITHWTYSEMQDAFGWSINQFLYFGGYPGAAPLADDEVRWVHYINDALIETTISRDILLMTQINKPVLLRRLFQFGCVYSGQILSYSKMLGELQDAGNTTTLAHYLDLLGGVGLLCGLNKYANQKVRSKGSSPKFCVMNTALMTAQANKSFEEAQTDPVFWGRLVESAVGAYLLNSIRGTQIELFYWRDGDKEVDFVLKRGQFLTALEVKSGSMSVKPSGLDDFIRRFKPSKVLLVGDRGLPVEQFLKTDVTELLQ